MSDRAQVRLQAAARDVEPRDLLPQRGEGVLGDVFGPARRARDLARQAVDERAVARVEQPERQVVTGSDARGEPWFLEINPLPSFARDGSFGILAEVLGISFEALLGEALASGLRRLGLR